MRVKNNSRDTPLNPWWKYSRDLTLAGFEAQRVMALRLMKLAAGGPAANLEASKMVTEKLMASAEAAFTLARGGSAEKVLTRYRTIMRANEQRLTRRRKR
jgi:hypothetical protein